MSGLHRLRSTGIHAQNLREAQELGGSGQGKELNAPAWSPESRQGAGHCSRGWAKQWNTEELGLKYPVQAST